MMSLSGLLHYQGETLNVKSVRGQYIKDLQDAFFLLIGFRLRDSTYMTMPYFILVNMHAESNIYGNLPKTTILKVVDP